MSFDEHLAERIRGVLGKRRGLVEKKMFGGLGFMLRGNMCCGVLKHDLIVRVSPDESERILAEPHTRPFDFTGKPMRGWVVIEPPGCDKDEALTEWVRMAVEFALSLPAKSK